MRGTAVVLVALLAGLAHQAHADERVQVQPVDRVSTFAGKKWGPWSKFTRLNAAAIAGWVLSRPGSPGGGPASSHLKPDTLRQVQLSGTPRLYTHYLAEHTPRTSHMQVYARDRVLVRLSSDRVETFAEKDLGVRYKRNVGSRGTMLYKITDNSSVESKIAQLKSQPSEWGGPGGGYGEIVDVRRN